MGDRGHIVIDDVVLYAHWRASELPEILAEALSHRERWHDDEYLTRIIADHLSERSSEFTGMGIGTEIHGDVWRVIDVDVDNQTVSFRKGKPSGAFEQYSFENFVDAFHKETPATA